jgi:hypothetical protein
MSGAIAPLKQTHGPGTAANSRINIPLTEVQRRKNMYSICTHCWDKDLDCDHESPCRECKTRRKVCAYVLCPVPICDLDIKCPGVHILPGLPLDSHNVGTAMHLVALLGLNRSSMQSYDIRKIQAIHDNERSAQSIYVLVQEDIKGFAQQRKKFHENGAQEMLRDSKKVPKMQKRAVSTVASMLVRLVEQQT